jgi:hypothetical protein
LPGAQVSDGAYKEYKLMVAAFLEVTGALVLLFLVALVSGVIGPFRRGWTDRASHKRLGQRVEALEAMSMRVNSRARSIEARKKFIQNLEQAAAQLEPRPEPESEKPLAADQPERVVSLRRV